MTFLQLVILLPILLGLAPGGMTVRSITVEDHVVIRVPVRPTPRIEWVEHKGPKCLDAQAIRGAFLSGNQEVDFILAGRKLLRAKLDENCPALDFYGGFYLSSEDERVCAKRDSIRSRIGASCQIERFRELRPKLRD